MNVFFAFVIIAALMVAATALANARAKDDRLKRCQSEKASLQARNRHLGELLAQRGLTIKQLQRDLLAACSEVKVVKEQLDGTIARKALWTGYSQYLEEVLKDNNIGIDLAFQDWVDTLKNGEE